MYRVEDLTTLEIALTEMLDKKRDAREHILELNNFLFFLGSCVTPGFVRGYDKHVATVARHESVINEVALIKKYLRDKNG